MIIETIDVIIKMTEQKIIVKHLNYLGWGVFCV